MKGTKTKKERKETIIYTLSFKQWYNKGKRKNQDKTGTTWRKKLNIYITKITKPKKKGKQIRVFFSFKLPKLHDAWQTFAMVLALS